MSGERVLLDTSFIQALLDGRDQYHLIAVKLVPLLQTAAEVWITETILIEVGDALSNINRTEAAKFINSCYQAANIVVVAVDSSLLKLALRLYQARPDKGWGMTDCISFIVMQDNGLTTALTADRHFVQAGFRALLLENI